MPMYRVHRLKDHLRQPFRAAPHVSGTAAIKPRDYVPGLPAADSPAEFPGEIISATSPYAAFFDRKESESPLLPGDVLEDESGALRIFKFVGFEEARWVQPEPAPAVTAAEVPAGA